ncbi:MAG: ATP synthase F0 subunit B [Desulfovibrio fairfieldensis]
MLDLNITLVFQLVNFFIAIFVLNILLIRPIREIIKKRNGVMDNLAGEADSFESQAAERLANTKPNWGPSGPALPARGRNAPCEQQGIVGTEERPRHPGRHPPQSAGSGRGHAERAAQSGE